MKKVLGIHATAPRHWVGDGFPVRTSFSYKTLGGDADPFLMLDLAGPSPFPPGDLQRGVGQHPHRGFETVTLVYQGEVEHRDSTGAGGVIGAGDVQWMTAGAGILHEEFHSRDFTRSGGTLEMVQLWVNLPARHKSANPSYQSLLNADIPAVSLPDGNGVVRVIAGEYLGSRGPARTFTAMDVLDISLRAGRATDMTLPAGRTVMLVVLRGAVRANGSGPAVAAQMLLLGREGTGLRLEADADSLVLLLSGEPINEPIVGHGPFVMNTAEQVRQAVSDFQSGRFGRIGPSERVQPDRIAHDRGSAGGSAVLRPDSEVNLRS